MPANETPVDPDAQTPPAPPQGDAGDVIAAGQAAESQPFGEASPGAFPIAADVRVLRLLKQQNARRRAAKGKGGGRRRR